MEEIRIAALSMPKALEDYPFGEGIAVFRIFDRKGPIFAMFSDEKHILNVRVPMDFFEISDTIDGITPLRVWKNWISVDLTTISKKQEIDDLITESWYEVTENLSKKKRELLNKN
jgi:predicted DNA-binding protein (MmcQ/YjbR family)